LISGKISVIACVLVTAIIFGNLMELFD